MGDMADLVLSHMMDVDEFQQRHLHSSVADLGDDFEQLYDYDGSEFPRVFSGDFSFRQYNDTPLLNRAIDTFRRKKMPVAHKQTPPGKKKPKGGSVLDRIAPIELGDEGLKLCVFGRSGTGKTTFTATWPKPMLTMICSGDGETRSIHNVKGVDAVTIIEPEEVKILVEHNRQTGKYQTMVLDHATGYQDLVLKKIMNVEELPAQLGFGTASMDQWGQLGLAMKEVLRDLLNQTCNVVVVCQEKTFNEDSSSEILKPYVNTALSPSVTGWLGPACDYLVQTFIREGETVEIKKIAGKDTKVKKTAIQYCLRTGPHSQFATKFRLPKGSKLPPFIIDPTYDKVMELVKGAIK